ncbi:uncharacterized protein TNCV_4217581 [Trichonephila clavipes]|nr:uncharacterized protein TNCV_4217581 [Trichonephila clavipes]
MLSIVGYHTYGLASILTGIVSNRACVGYAWPTNYSPSTPPTSLPELRRAFRDEWCNIPQDQIDNLILSMPGRCVLLLHDNARPHTSRITQELIESFGWEVLDHAPYSSDLAPSDFCLFRYLKHNLGRKRFSDNKEVNATVNSWLSNLVADFFKEGLQNLILNRPSSFHTLSKFIWCDSWRCNLGQSLSNHGPHVFYPRKIRRASRPGKQFNLVIDEEPLDNACYVWSRIILLKYDCGQALKVRNDNWLQHLGDLALYV